MKVVPISLSFEMVPHTPRSDNHILSFDQSRKRCYCYVFVPFFVSHFRARMHYFAVFAVSSNLVTA